MTKYYWDKEYYFKCVHTNNLPDYNLDPPEDDDYEEENDKIDDPWPIPDSVVFNDQPRYFNW